MCHYLDNYITIGPPKPDICQCNLHTIKDSGAYLGLPQEEDKSEGPTTCIVFLGMELNSITKTICLPDNKLAKLRLFLQDFFFPFFFLGGGGGGGKRELLCIIGYLQHVSKAVRHGCLFVRQLTDLTGWVP